MPRFNGSGQWVIGLNGGQWGYGASVQGTIVPPASGPICWLSPTELVFNAGTKVVKRTTSKPDQTVLDPAGANAIVAAGAGYWAKGIAVPGQRASMTIGNQSGTVVILSGAWPMAASEDGAIAYKPNQQSGVGFRLWRHGKPSVVISDTALSSDVACVKGRDQLVWCDPDGLKSNRPIRSIAGRPWKIATVVVDEALWVLYQVGDGTGNMRLLLHPEDSTVGYQVALQPNIFGPCVRLASARIMEVRWTTTEGEALSSMASATVDLANPRIDLNGGGSHPPPPAPTVTIASYAPTHGPAPLHVDATAKLGGGPADTLTWLANGAEIHTQPATDVDYTYVFDTAGQFNIGVRVKGPGGNDQTATPRTITVEGSPAPGPTGLVHLKAWNGKFVTAENGGDAIGTLTATRDVAGPWETFELVDTTRREDNLVVCGLRSQTHRFVAAELGGGGELHANREALGPWEQFAMLPSGPHRFAFRTADQVHFWCADGEVLVSPDGYPGPVLNATRPKPDQDGWTGPGPWETFDVIPVSGGGTPPPGGGAQPPPPEYRGAAATRGRHLEAGGRDLLWRGVTSFKLVKLVADGQIDQVRALLQSLAGMGFGVYRVLTTANVLFDLSPSQGLAALPQTADLIRAVGGYVEAVALADTVKWAESALGDHVRHVGEIAAAHPNVFVQVANEHYHPTQHVYLHDAAHLPTLRALLPAAIVATDSPSQDDEALVPTGRYVTRHRDRTRNGYDNVRRVYEIMKVSRSTGLYTVDDEPKGAADVAQPGKRDNDPAIFYTQGVLARVCETLGSTFHSDCGLASQPFTAIQQDCATAFLRGTAILPDTTIVTQCKNAREGGSPVKEANFRVDSSGKPNPNGTVDRVYSGLIPEGAAVACVGVSGDPGIIWADGWKDAGVIDGMGGCLVKRAVRG